MSKYRGLIDSHCHLTAPQFNEDLDAVLERAQDAGVAGINVIGYTVEHSLKAVEMAKRSENLWAAVGVSPHDVKDAPRDFAQSLQAMAAENRDKVVAIGETGLDFFHKLSPRGMQIASFARHIELAVRLARPLVVHTRDAFADTHSILIDNGAPKVGGVFHCFTGTPEEALKAVELNFYVSFSGIITFKKATQVRESASIIPDDKLLVETDAPYLSPTPMRGKRNEPSYLPYIVEELARIRNMRPEHIAEMTAQNAQRLFLRNCVRRGIL
jgi:TatD DNase family protein